MVMKTAFPTLLEGYWADFISAVILQVSLSLSYEILVAVKWQNVAALIWFTELSARKQISVLS